MKRQPSILVVNDDGVYGPGLRPLISAMRRLGRVTVVVPDQERSADSHCLTLHKPLRVRELSRGFFALNGSPADCARFGLLEILKGRADLVVSGINSGYNLGEDVVYSGTVAAAMEGTMLEVPSCAFSRQSGPRPDFRPAAAFARKLALQVLRRGLPPGICLNVNVPDLPASKIRGAQAVRLGKRIYGTQITVRSDPRGDRYFWLAGKNVSGVALPGSDVAAVGGGRIAVTPLHVDSTDLPTLHLLKRWGL